MVQATAVACSYFCWHAGCLKGAVLDTETKNCVACAKGTYAAAGAASCSNCPAGSTTPRALSGSVEDCNSWTPPIILDLYVPPYISLPDTPGLCGACVAVCDAGRGGAGCALCAQGTYSAGGDGAACLTCDTGSSNTGTGNTGCTSESQRVASHKTHTLVCATVFGCV